MKQKTIRELGGEIWGEISMLQNASNENTLLGSVDYKVVEELVDLTMGILARHSGATIVNDEDLPVTPLPKRNFPQD